jgi:hypothetical protein
VEALPFLLALPLEIRIERTGEKELTENEKLELRAKAWDAFADEPREFTIGDTFNAGFDAGYNAASSQIVWKPFPTNKPDENHVDGYLVTRELSDGSRIVHEAYWVTWGEGENRQERWEAGGDGYPSYKDVIAFTDWKPTPFGGLKDGK